MATSNTASGGSISQAFLRWIKAKLRDTTQAIFKWVKAKLRDLNPIWTAIKGAWSGASPGLKVALVSIVALTLLLGPVVLVLLLLGLLVAAIVAAVRAASARQ
jgi:hypothetical protein